MMKKRKTNLKNTRKYCAKTFIFLCVVIPDLATGHRRLWSCPKPWQQQFCRALNPRNTFGRQENNRSSKGEIDRDSPLQMLTTLHHIQICHHHENCSLSMRERIVLRLKTCTLYTYNLVIFFLLLSDVLISFKDFWGHLNKYFHYSKKTKRFYDLRAWAYCVSTQQRQRLDFYKFRANMG